MTRQVFRVRRTHSKQRATKRAKISSQRANIYSLLTVRESEIIRHWCNRPVKFYNIVENVSRRCRTRTGRRWDSGVVLVALAPGRAHFHDYERDKTSPSKKRPSWFHLLFLLFQNRFQLRRKRSQLFNTWVTQDDRHSVLLRRICCSFHSLQFFNSSVLRVVLLGFPFEYGERERERVGSTFPWQTARPLVNVKFCPNNSRDSPTRQQKNATPAAAGFVWRIPLIPENVDADRLYFYDTRSPAGRRCQPGGKQVEEYNREDE